MGSAALILLTPIITSAEGSRDLYPAGYVGSRADLEWTPAYFGPGDLIARRTILNVYAEDGEAILMGSSSLGLGGNVLLYTPNSITGAIGAELIDGNSNVIPRAAGGSPNLLVDCAADQPGTGNIPNRSAELAGPQPSADPNAFTPCEYIIPPGGGGIYHVIMLGIGGNTDPNGALNFTGDAAKNSTRAWDVTVREVVGGVIQNDDIDGRLFSNYLAMFTGGNGRPLNSRIYLMSLDGYLYQADFNALDPNGFVLYGNQLGFFDDDGVTPLYRNVVAAGNASRAGQLNQLAGGVGMQRPQFPIFFNDSRAELLRVIDQLGIPTTPVPPTVSNLAFDGDVDNTSVMGNGGTFSFDVNVTGTYELVISRNIASPNFDPTVPENRVLRGTSAVGTNNINWDGVDNSGNPFPPGTGYSFRLQLRAGELHFPLLDAENSVNGGPSYTLINPPDVDGDGVGDCPDFPAGCSTAFYDDRGYITLNGNAVGTLNAALCGEQFTSTNASPNPRPSVSDLITGYDSRSTQRGFGTMSGGNSNQSCLPPSNGTGSFGDAKGLNTWTFYPSPDVSNVLNIVDTPDDLPTPTPPATGGSGSGGGDDEEEDDDIVEALTLPPGAQATPPAPGAPFGTFNGSGDGGQGVDTATGVCDPNDTRCLRLLQVTRLPSTGETPWWRGYVTLLVAATPTLILLLLRWLWLRIRAT